MKVDLNAFREELKRYASEVKKDYGLGNHEITTFAINLVDKKILEEKKLKKELKP